MPAKAAPNAFYMFMLAQQKKLRESSGRSYSMAELPSMCREAWKNLSSEERSHYDVLAKREKQKRNVGNRGSAKMDSKRQVIADRKDPQKEEKKRREQEVRLMLSSWAGRDVRDITFYILDFQVMYDDLSDNFHLPMEMGLVSFTLRQGITDYMHRFPNPGDPPVGNRRIAQEYSELTHQIPLNFPQAVSNFHVLCDELKSFLMQDPDSNEMPPVYCLSTHRQQVEHCLDFIYDKADILPFMNKIYCLEDLVATLISSTGRKEDVSQTQVYDILIQNRWDYISNIRCSYHNECDCSYCSLSMARRFCFAIFDILASVLRFKLTKYHVPEEAEASFTVTEVGASHREPDRSTRKWRNRDDEDRVTTPSYQPSAVQSAGRERAQGACWQPPTQRLQMIQLSDHSSDEYDGKHDDLDDDDDTDFPHQQYTLKELRKPKSLSMVHNSLSNTTVPQASAATEVDIEGFAAAISNVRPGYAAAISTVRPGYAAAISTVRPGYAAAISTVRPGYAADISTVRPGYAAAISTVRPGYAADISTVRPGYAADISTVRPGYAAAISTVRPGYAADISTVRPGYAAAISTVRPWGAQMTDDIPTGAFATSQRFVAPPPGFRGRPLGPQPVTPPPTSSWPALSRQDHATDAPPRPRGRGLSSARGRGYAARQ